MATGQLNEHFLRLFAKSQARVYAYVLSLVFNETAAEEIFQETCVVLWQKFDQFEEGTNFAAWACKIAHLNVLKWREQHARRREVYDDAFLGTIASSQEQRADQFDARRLALGQCVERLRAEDRELLRARYDGNRTARQVARDLGRPENTVYKALQRLRRMLLACIQARLAEEGHA